jgi:peptide deformylase
MAKRNVIEEGNEILKKISEPIIDFGVFLSNTILGDLRETLFRNGNGIGLAAPQIGINKRVIFISFFGTELEIINPKILEKSKEEEISEEGCLSIPEKKFLVKRSKEIRIEFFDRIKNKIEIKCDGLLARCIQHEIDHLDGILISEKGNDEKNKV